MLFYARAGTGMRGETRAPLGYRALVGIGISWEERWQLVDIDDVGIAAIGTHGWAHLVQGLLDATAHVLPISLVAPIL